MKNFLYVTLTSITLNQFQKEFTFRSAMSLETLHFFAT